MRLQDKLVGSLGTTRDPSYRRFLLRSMDRIVAGPDSSAVLGVLLSGSGSVSAGESLQSRITFSHFLPRHVRRLYGLVPRLRSVVLTDPPAGDIGHVPHAIPPAELTAMMSSILPSIRTRLPGLPEAPRARVLSALEPIPSPEVDRILLERITGDAFDPFAAFLLAHRGGPTWSEALPDLAARAQAHPELLLTLTARSVEGPSVAPLLEAAIHSVESAPHPAAICLEGLPPEARGRVFEQISRTRRGWAIVQALTSIARTGDESDLEWILRTLSDFSHPMIRVEAARSLGRIRSPRAREACKVLIAADPSSAYAAAALDSLIRQGMPSEDRQRIFGLAAGSRSPEVLALSCLGLLETDPEKSAHGIGLLLRAGPEARLHALHALAYLPGIDATRILLRYVVEDMDPLVRGRAALFLAYQAPTEELSALITATLEDCPDEVVATLAWIAVHASEHPSTDLISRIEARGLDAPGPFKREILACLGPASSQDARDRIVGGLKKATDRDEILGLLTAGATRAKAWSDLDLERFLEGSDPEVVAAASLAALPLDPGRALASLAPLLEGSDQAFSHGLLALETIAGIARWAADHPRYLPWVRAFTSPARPPHRPSRPLELASPAVLEPSRLLIQEAPRVNVAALTRSIQGASTPSPEPRSRLKEPTLDPRGLDRVPRALTRTAIGVLAAGVLGFVILVMPSSGARPLDVDRTPGFELIRLVEGAVQVGDETFVTGANLGVPLTLESRDDSSLELAASQVRMRWSAGARARMTLTASRQDPGASVVCLQDVGGEMEVTIPPGAGVLCLIAGPAIAALSPGSYQVHQKEETLEVVTRDGTLHVASEVGASTRHAGPRRVVLSDGRVKEDEEL